MSRKKAIDEYCKQCIFDEKAGMGTWRQQVEGCPMSDCPLFEYRPISRTRRSKEATSSDT